MTGSSNPMGGAPAGSADDGDLANKWYVSGYQNPGTTDYDPDSIDKAIMAEITKMKEAIAAGGHVSMGETMMLMYLMQGFGGEVVGVDGKSSAALSKVQDWVSKAWDVTNRCSGGKFIPLSTKAYDTMISQARADGSIPKGSDSIDGHKLDPHSATVEFLIDMAEAKTALSKAPNLSSTEVTQVEGALNSATSMLSTVPGNPVDPLLTLYNMAQSSGTGKATKQGNSTFLDAFTRDMTTVNQQVTGASQVMSTQAKSDSKTMQAEATGYNNYMQMIKKLLGYITPQQRPS